MNKQKGHSVKLPPDKFLIGSAVGKCIERATIYSTSRYLEWNVDIALEDIMPLRPSFL